MSAEVLGSQVAKPHSSLQEIGFFYKYTVESLLRSPLDIYAWSHLASGRDVDGTRLPHGRGRLLLKGGLGASAFTSLAPLGEWLRGLGYEAYYSKSKKFINSAEPPEWEESFQETENFAKQGPVGIIGQSLGGMRAVIEAQSIKNVRFVATLGSMVHSQDETFPKSPNTFINQYAENIFRKYPGFMEHKANEITKASRNLRNDVMYVCIWSKDDGVVPKENSRIFPDEKQKNGEIIDVVEMVRCSFDLSHDLVPYRKIALGNPDLRVFNVEIPDQHGLIGFSWRTARALAHTLAASSTELREKNLPYSKAA